MKKSGSNSRRSQLIVKVDELTQTNNELRDARSAALNLMEDAVLSREALRISEERMRTLKEAYQSMVKGGGGIEESLRFLAQLVDNETSGEARTAFYIVD